MGTLTSGKHGSNGRRKRIWVQQVAVETDKLEMRVQAARSRGTLTDSQDVVAAGVIDMARKAKAAALRQDPSPAGSGTGGGGPWSRRRTARCTPPGRRWSTSTTRAS